MEFRKGVGRRGGLTAVVALLSVAAVLRLAEAAVRGWPLKTYELEAEAEVRLTSCPDGWKHDGHQCLLYVPAAAGWSQAQRHCENEQAGATLASISDVFQMTQLLLRARRAGQDQVWIGLGGRPEEGGTVWDWADGSPLSFEAWEEGTGPEAEHGAGDGDVAEGDMPQLCAAFSTHKKNWSPVPCETSLRFFCGYVMGNELD